MSEKELNAYRFSPEQEPTDEMLEQIMREVAEEARISNQKAKRFDKTSKMGERHRKHTEWTQINAYRK